MKSFSLYTVLALLCAVFIEAQDTNIPPVVPVGCAGTLTLAWDWSTNNLPFQFVLVYPNPNGDQSSVTITNDVTFYIRASTPENWQYNVTNYIVTNWVTVATVTNSTMATFPLLPVKARVYAVSASNYLGETHYSLPLFLAAPVTLSTSSTNLNTTVNRK